MTSLSLLASKTVTVGFVLADCDTASAVSNFFFFFNIHHINNVTSKLSVFKLVLCVVE